MTNVENTNVTTNKEQARDYTKSVETNKGTSIEVSQISFVPEISMMNLSTIDISRAINSTLKAYVDQYSSSRVYVKGDRIGVEICVLCSSRLIKNMAIVALGDKARYEMTDELKQKLSPFINVNAPVKTRIIELGKRKEAMIIELDMVKTLTSVLQKPEEGFVYRVAGISARKKNGEAFLTIYKQRPNATIPSLGRNNNNNGGNKKHNNHNNNGGNKKHHNNNGGQHHKYNNDRRR